MPLIIEGGRVPTRWAERQTRDKKGANAKTAGQHRAIRLAFINNMPDAALEDTEMQFFELVNAASGKVPVYVTLFTLPGLTRTERGIEHLHNYYCEFGDLWKHKFDGAIVTGTEPRESDLRNESYWRLLTQVFDWAARETISTILSCLAAHASVLHNDNVPRHRLQDKQFGVFASYKTSSDELTSAMPNVVAFPHSRWNEVREADLQAAGYSIVTKSSDAGVDLFTKKQQRSLLVHFQGHPEYSAETLFKEYRRDVRRFLRNERETYPSMPQGYFDDVSRRAYASFQAHAIANRNEQVMSGFPECVAGIANTWQQHALSVYQGWIGYMSAGNGTEIASLSRLHSGLQPKPSGMARDHACGN